MRLWKGLHHRLLMTGHESFVYGDTEQELQVDDIPTQETQKSSKKRKIKPAIDLMYGIILISLSVVKKILTRPRAYIAKELEELKEMAKKMRDKYYKYFGPVTNINMILYYEVILDPQHKLGSLKFKFSRMYPVIPQTESSDNENVMLDTPVSSPVSTPNLLDSVKREFCKLFSGYKKLYGCDIATIPSPLIAEGTFHKVATGNLMELDEEDDLLKALKKAKGKGKHAKTELERYLPE